MATRTNKQVASMPDISGFAFEVKYKDGATWEASNTERAFRILGDHYTGMDAIIDDMKTGQIYMTTFADYRLVARQ